MAPLMQFVMVARGEFSDHADATLRAVRAAYPTSPIVLVTDDNNVDGRWQRLAQEHGALLATLPPVATVALRLAQVLRAVPQNHHLVVVYSDVAYSAGDISKLGVRGARPAFLGTAAVVPPTVIALSASPMARADIARTFETMLIHELWELRAAVDSTWMEAGVQP